MIQRNKFVFTLLAAAALGSCSDDSQVKPEDNTPSTELSEEYYTGGKLGTAFNTTSMAYEQPTPVIEEQGLDVAFKSGETFFEKNFTTDKEGLRSGLGPLFIRSSCIHCHPGYGHGKRIEGRFNTNEIGNGYLLVIYNTKDNNYVSSLTGMPQTQAVQPFKAPIDESKINIVWHKYTDEWGNKFPDGTSYELIYPELQIPEDAYYVPLLDVNGDVIPYSRIGLRLESTIGIYGTGLLDAISDEDLKAEYAAQEKQHGKINPAIFANGNWVKTYGTTTYPLRFTYALSRGVLQDGAGSNAIWNITNVTRSDRRYHYMTTAYAEKASKDPEVQKDFYTYFPERKTAAGIEQDIYNYLMAKDLPAEMSDKEYIDLMVWHRGLAVPAARNLDDPTVQLGKEIFTEIGCASCHKPSWTTGDDEIRDPNGFFEKAENRNKLPRYPNQKIWPYTDMVQHRLFMENDIRGGWCRTTPLWGRGLSQKCTGADDRLHDCRARNVIEAIMWHGNQKSDARWSIEKFRNLRKEEREAIVKFIEAI